MGRVQGGRFKRGRVQGAVLKGLVKGGFKGAC
jgi:hypothetical protein